jgi:hypothetical protein
MKMLLALLLAFTTTAQAAYVQTPYPIGKGGTGLSTVPSAGQILIGNAGGTAYALALMSGDATLAASGVLTIANSAITSAKMANMAAHTYKGNNTGSTAAPADVTSTQLTADLNAFTTSLQGMAPASGGGTSNFLRADGTWAAPPAGSGTVTSVAASVPSVLSISGSPITTSGTLAITYSGTALPVANGGTNSTTALNNNRFMVSSGSAIVEAAAVTANSAVASDSNGLPVASSTTATELGFVHNVTSAIQTQLNVKQALAFSVTDGGNTAYTIASAPADQHVRDTTTLTANRAYTLPVCNASNIGERHEVKNLSAQTFQIILTAAGSDNIDGSATLALNPGDSVPVICAAFASAGTWDIE